VVDHVPTTRPFKPNLPTGRVLRNLTNSAMKMHVAHRSQSERNRILRAPQPKLTPFTVTDPGELAEQLSRIVQEGVSFDLEEQDLGVCAISAPVFGPTGDVKAVVTLVLPPERFGPEDRQSKVDAVKNTAAELSRYLSGAKAEEAVVSG
jgi:DNA-binding IclR family transcriptional regulator